MERRGNGAVGGHGKKKTEWERGTQRGRERDGVS